MNKRAKGLVEYLVRRQEDCVVAVSLPTAAAMEHYVHGQPRVEKEKQLQENGTSPALVSRPKEISSDVCNRLLTDLIRFGERFGGFGRTTRT